MPPLRRGSRHAQNISHSLSTANRGLPLNVNSRARSALAANGLRQFERLTPMLSARYDFRDGLIIFFESAAHAFTGSFGRLHNDLPPRMPGCADIFGQAPTVASNYTTARRARGDASSILIYREAEGAYDMRTIPAAVISNLHAQPGYLVAVAFRCPPLFRRPAQ